MSSERFWKMQEANLKCCSKCLKEKPLEAFYKKAQSKDGRQSSCKDCNKEPSARYFQENKVRLQAKHKEYVEANRTKIKLYKREYDTQHKVRVNTQKALWKKKNLSYYAAASAKRKSSKLHATPPWVGTEHLKRIESIYKACRNVTERSGKVHHVDHIVPLQGENVCGLHVWWNLRIIPAEMNLSKGNRFENAK